MPVHFEWDRDLEEWDWSGAGGLEPPSEEFWSKFEELPDLGENLETLFAEVSGLEGGGMVGKHDCMWAGTCLSEDCRKEERKRTVILEKGSVSILTPSLTTTSPVAPAAVVRPETPQSSDTEDADEVEVLPASQVTGQHRPPTVTSVFLDHDYDSRKKTVVIPEELGVQTPSDSEEEAEETASCGEEEEEEEECEEEECEDEESSDEEEIDVVSVGSPQRRGLPGQLPTNPTTRIRHQLQETVADSLLTASRAVSRRLQATKRKRCPSFSSGRRRAPKKSRFSSAYPQDNIEKRSLHNNMERMRRIDLRNAFEDLRLLVPAIADSHKAAKVTILKDATHYVKELNFKDKNLCLQIDALRSEQDRLRRTLSHLRRILAFKNIQK